MGTSSSERISKTWQSTNSAVLVSFLWHILVVAHSPLQYRSASSQATLSGPINATGLTVNSVPYSTRQYWMRQANQALFTLSGPCPFAAFGTVVVNHTSQPSGTLGELICIGANNNSLTGNPTLHGEIAAINNCSKVLTDPTGKYNLTASQATAALQSLTLYTNAESCPMCASAIRWSGFKEYVYGTSIEYLINKGWGQIRVSSYEIFKNSFELPTMTRMIAEVLTNETDPLFTWQYDPSYSCPIGCKRRTAGTSCVAS